jgi:hypothetical protein
MRQLHHWAHGLISYREKCVSHYEKQSLLTLFDFSEMTKFNFALRNTVTKQLI